MVVLRNILYQKKNIKTIEYQTGNKGLIGFFMRQVVRETDFR